MQSLLNPYGETPIGNKANTTCNATGELCYKSTTNLMNFYYTADITKNHIHNTDI